MASTSIRKAIERDIEKYLETFAYTYCKKAEEEFAKLAASAIEQFYSDYVPDYYDRTFDLKNNSYDKFFHNNGKGWYRGGVRINSGKMKAYMNGNKEVDPFIVTTLAWEAGYHGHPSEGIQTTPAIDILIDMINSTGIINDITKSANHAAESNSYEIINI